VKLSRISRIVQILTTLQSGHGYSVDDLTKILGVSRRTIFRDLKELQAISVPYHFDSKTGGYTIDPEYFLSPVDLNLQEALSLLLLVHKARNHLPVPFKNSALMAGLKVENNLPDKIRQYCNTTLQNISIKPSSHAPMDLLDKVFSLLQSAIRKKRKVRLHYTSFYEGTDIATVLCPYHLMYNKRAWYVIGRSSMHKSVRTFKLNRIRSLQVQDKCFLKNKTFDAHEYLGKAWSMIPEGRIYNVSLRFSKKVAKNVSEVQWHCSQKTTQGLDGTLNAEFRVDGLGEISWWVLSYGDQVEVLRPAALRKQIKETARRMVKLNAACQIKSQSPTGLSFS
jgi:predicted DNA-binding transcriptional regulator YafY